MTYSNTNFNKKTILITGGAGFVGSNLAFYFQKNFPQSHVIVFDCFRNEAVFSNGNLQSFGHYKNLFGFASQMTIGDIYVQGEPLISSSAYGAGFLISTFKEY